MGKPTDTPSLDAQRKLLSATREKVIRPPRGVEFQSDQERTLWAHYTRARANDDWRTVDLLQLIKAIRLEIQIEEQQAALDSEGYLVDGGKGGDKANPRCNIIHQMHNRHLGIMRALALTVIHTPTSGALKEKKISNIRRNTKSGGADDLDYLA